MKVCRSCGVEKDIGSFYKHPKMLDGHLNICIDCTKVRVKKHRDANIEKIREYDKSRANNPKRVQARLEYSKTERGKEATKKARKNYAENYPMKRAAHVVAGNAIRDGRLIRETSCSECGSSESIEGHHDDYSKPLDVRWLCRQCHVNWHKSNKPIFF